MSVSLRTNRIYSKGIKLFVAFRATLLTPADAAFRRVEGVLEMPSIPANRAGEIDATELVNDCDDILVANDQDPESYIVTHQYPGSKKFDVVNIMLNKVPLKCGGADTSKATYTTLAWAYGANASAQWSINTGKGTELVFNGYVNNLDKSVPRDGLVTVNLQLLPENWFIYRPLPVNYAPFGNTDPKFGPPWYDFEQKTWSATLPTALHPNTDVVPPAVPA